MAEANPTTDSGYRFKLTNPDGQSFNRRLRTNNHVDASAIPALRSWAENYAEVV